MKKPELPAGPGERAKKLAESLGYELVKRAPVDTAKPKAGRHALFLKLPPRTEKHAAIIRRVGLLLNRRSNFRPSQELDFEGGRLADEMVELMVDLINRRREFRDLSDRDCQRMFWAKAERICDRSNGLVGFPAWWTK